MTRVLICGGRSFGDRVEEKHLLIREIDALHRARSFSTVIEGGAPGADTGARLFAEWWSIPCITMEANWQTHGRAAGPMRNQRMLDEGKPDLVVAFPGGRGTADMVARARKAGIEVIEVPAPTLPASRRIGS